MNKNDMTPKQRWLEFYGGRSYPDVLTDELGKEFILLWDGRKHEYVREYLPDNLQGKK